MRYTVNINAVKCQEWGLNLAQGALFDLLNQSASWAKTFVIDGEVYYWVSRNMVIDEIPLAYSKPDTVYRALKDLAKKGLIEHIKKGHKDLIRLTPRGKEWNAKIHPNTPSNLGNKSENENKNSDLNPNNEQNSEINPRKLGNKSEKTAKNSEINPTDKNTNYKSTKKEEESVTTDFDKQYENYKTHLQKAGVLPVFGFINEQELRLACYEFTQYWSDKDLSSSERIAKLISHFGRMTPERRKQFLTESSGQKPLHPSHIPVTETAPVQTKHDPDAIAAMIKAAERKAAAKLAGGAA